MDSKRKLPVAFTKPPEPAFLTKFKQQIGYKEGATVDTKREELEQATPEDDNDREDEKPTVVVLKSGDLTEEEALRINSDILKPDEEQDGKIKFRKPTKRPAVADAVDDIKNKIEKKESKMAQVKNKSLLSFDDEEDDDDVD